MEDAPPPAGDGAGPTAGPVDSDYAESAAWMHDAGSGGAAGGRPPPPPVYALPSQEYPGL